MSYPSNLYGFKMWVSLRKLELPLLTSRHVLPVTAALWNRSKNGSDIATSAIRAAWFPLPNKARTPAAMVIQRLLYIVPYNILKISAIASYQGETKIDNFRNKTQRVFGSYRSFVIMMRDKIIGEKLRSVRAISDEAYSMATDENNVTNMTIPVTATPKARARPLRYSNTYTICQPVSEIMVTGLTPSNKRTREKEAKERRLMCQRPLLVKMCDEKAILKRGKKCDICKRQTVYWCLGCHRHFGNDIPSHGSFRDGVDEKLKGKESIVAVKLGSGMETRHKKRKKIAKDEVTTFHFTCHVRGHLSMLEKKDSSVIRAISL